MKYTLLFAFVVLLSGCVPESDKYMIDSKLRAERFDACMHALPAGPVSTQYNDWSEVVDSCEAAARNQSLKIANYVNGKWVFQNGKPVE